MYDDSFRRLIDKKNREVEKERIEMEHVQSRPRLITSMNNNSTSYYDDEVDDDESHYGTEGTNQESIAKSTEF